MHIIEYICKAYPKEIIIFLKYRGVFQKSLLPLNVALPQVFFRHILRTVPKTFDSFQNSCGPLSFSNISLCTIQIHACL